eukprot:TRINITY_DN6699_c0_g1_i3.p2 TRINITY_DN6699_c0_g1~~TRINITY_DN6699_c0_g1_i3.p2  ORF type:complete len:201 (+),score=38.49 TRINITY_DN6699_c0_g1_i3:944-1546(+)
MNRAVAAIPGMLDNRSAFVPGLLTTAATRVIHTEATLAVLLPICHLNSPALDRLIRACSLEYDVAASKWQGQADPDYDNPGDLSDGRLLQSGAYGLADENQAEFDPVYDVATDKLVTALNKRTSMRRSMRASVRASRKGKKEPVDEPLYDSVALNPVKPTDLSRPSWVCVSDAAKEATAGSDLRDLLSQFKAQHLEDDYE